jgi:TonB-linked SusC/RagA family outer membrane protein
MYKKYTKIICSYSRCSDKLLLIMNSALRRISDTDKKKWIMRANLTTIILISTLLQVSAATFAQKVTLKQNNVSLKTVFDEIKKQTGYNVVWDSELLKGTKPVAAKFVDTEVKKLLDAILPQQNLDYTISDKTIVIRKKESSLLDKIREFISTSHTIRGLLLTKTGEPLAGATIRIKGASTFAVTNQVGGFSININSDEAILIISYTGYETREIPVTSSSDQLTIRMVLSDSKLDEVQVIAYGTISRRLNTGSVSSLTAKDIEKQPVLNPLQALEGRMTGVVISQNSGIAGSNYRIQIEGQNSLRNTSTDNGNLPFFVIDGVPFISSSLSTTGLAPYSNAAGLASNGASPLNSINPQDIESIDVLKDADATAIYGSRGANGVILITTKKGRAGEVKVDANVYSGAGKVTRKMDMLNLDQYLTMRYEALKNQGIANPATADYDINGIWDKTRYTDWQDELLGGTAHMNDAQLTATGGNVNTQFRLSGAFHNETSVFPGFNTTNRANFSSNITTQSSNSKFKANIGINYSYGLQRLAGADLTNNALVLSPDAPALYDAAGNLNWENNTFTNPLGSTQTPYTGKTNNLIASGNLSYRLLKDLTLSSSLGYTNTRVDEIKKTYKTSVRPSQQAAQPLRSNFGNSSNISWIIEPQLNYDKTFGKNHLHVLAGVSAQDQVTDFETTLATNFISIDQMDNPGAAPSNNVSVTRDYADYKFGSIFGRLTYDWDQKYLINISARRDGSSRFGTNKQFANFGAIGAAWIFSREKFIKDAFPFLSFGKFRGSYGTTGSDQIGNYQFLDDYAISGQYDLVRGLLPIRLYNPDFQWEVNKKMEIALETGFLHDRILATFSYFRNRSSDQLVSYPLAPTTGFSGLTTNLAATVQNTGLAMELNTINVKGKDFSWSSNFNLTVPKNKLISFPNLAGSSYYTKYVIGQPLTIQKSFTVTGVDPQTGLYITQDVDNNGIYNSADYSSIKNVGQKFFGGLGNSITYKNFQLDFFFQFVKQDGKNYLSYFGLPGSGPNSNQPVEVINRWQKPGDITNIQRFGTISGTFDTYYANANYLFSNRNVTDASYIRLKNVALSYQLPTSLVQNLKIKNCRVYFQGQNVLTFTKYLGLDPESQGLGLPPLQYLTAGLQITL